MGNKILAAKVLLKNYFPSHRNQIEIVPKFTEKGTSFHLHQPIGIVEPRKTLVMLYGMDYSGEEDPRLVKFANAFARSGFRVAIPSLPGLKGIDFQLGDVDLICDLVRTVGRWDAEPVGMVAFSIGAGYALVGAAQLGPDFQPDPIVLFSPHYNLNELWETWKDRELDQPSNAREWDHFLWNKMALAYRGLEDMDFSAREREEFLSRLKHYCSEDSLAVKKAYYDQALAKRRVPSYGDLPVKPEVLAALSPQGQLDTLRGMVMLIHDLNDLIIPPTHTDHIFTELQSRLGNPTVTVRKIITPLLSHVTINKPWKLADGIVILDMLGELFDKSVRA